MLPCSLETPPRGVLKEHNVLWPQAEGSTHGFGHISLVLAIWPLAWRAAKRCWLAEGAFLETPLAGTVLVSGSTRGLRRLLAFDIGRVAGCFVVSGSPLYWVSPLVGHASAAEPPWCAARCGILGMPVG